MNLNIESLTVRMFNSAFNGDTALQLVISMEGSQVVKASNLGLDFLIGYFLHAFL